MSSELLHEILINGIYSRLDKISNIISQQGNRSEFFLNCDLECSRDKVEEPPELHVKRIEFRHNRVNNDYDVVFRLMHSSVTLIFMDSSLRKAFDQAVTEFRYGKFKHLIPQESKTASKPTIPISSIIRPLTGMPISMARATSDDIGSRIFGGKTVREIINTANEMILDHAMKNQYEYIMCIPDISYKANELMEILKPIYPGYNITVMCNIPADGTEAKTKITFDWSNS
jgi:hypothetical protein